jgi:acyl-CoA reductase-like NAD-dependent aldehyde dehydrogenase
MSASGTALRSFALRIGNEWVSGGERDVIRLPYDGSPVADAPRGTPELVDRAVRAAREAAPQIAALTNNQRAELIERIAALIRRDLADYAWLIAAETGKPIQEARGEAERSLQTLIASAQAARELAGEVVPIDAAAIGAGRLGFTVREPVGVIGVITPFNVPLNLALHKLGPAMAAGNAVVHKPGEQTPLSALRLAQTFEEAGAIPGAYNVVTGPGAEVGAALVESPGVDMITFTGSVPVGKWIRAHSGLKKVTLELGGNSAVILEPEADLSAAVPRVIQGGYAHSGQICISVQRVYVHESIEREFVERLAAAVAALKLGHPFEDSTQVSSLISEKAARRVEEWTAEAVNHGARRIAGGDRRNTTIVPGFLTGVPSNTRFMQQELFGPLVAVNTYRTLDEAIDAVNDSPYGLQAGIYTDNLKRAFQSARRLRVGGVLINDVPTFRADHMPYGGVKESGIGREGPRYAVEEMTESKLICWRV